MLAYNFVQRTIACICLCVPTAVGTPRSKSHSVTKPGISTHSVDKVGRSMPQKDQAARSLTATAHNCISNSAGSICQILWSPRPGLKPSSLALFTNFSSQIIA